MFIKYKQLFVAKKTYFEKKHIKKKKNIETSPKTMVSFQFQQRLNKYQKQKQGTKKNPIKKNFKLFHESSSA
jgi:hypothetical protein